MCARVHVCVHVGVRNGERNPVCVHAYTCMFVSGVVWCERAEGVEEEVPRSL